MPRGLNNPRTLLLLTILGVLVLALLPLRWSGWVHALRNPVDVIVRPVSGPMSTLSTWLRPVRPTGNTIPGSDTSASNEAAELERQRDQFKWLYLRELDRNTELETLVRDLQGGAAWSRPPGVRRVEASRVGADLAAGTIDFARGTNDGVRSLSAVAVARRSEQLVAVAVDARPNVTTFRLITDKKLQPKFIVAIVIPDGPVTSEQLANPPRCQLRPLGDGTLVADNVGVTSAESITPGMIARLADDTWPDAARMLVLGRVVRVEPADNPLYRRIIVRPDIDITRVPSVIVQFPSTPASSGANPTGGGAP